jgi:hypothetical protein
MLLPTTIASGFVPPCIATRAAKPPAGPDWVHEIKHDGYRLQVRREGDAVRLFTRRGYDWSGRYPAIVVTPMKLRATSFTLDGEAVVCGPDGIAIFDALHRHGTASEAMKAGHVLVRPNQTMAHLDSSNRRSCTIERVVDYPNEVDCSLLIRSPLRIKVLHRFGSNHILLGLARKVQSPDAVTGHKQHIVEVGKLLFCSKGAMAGHDLGVSVRMCEVGLGRGEHSIDAAAVCEVDVGGHC